MKKRKKIVIFIVSILIMCFGATLVYGATENFMNREFKNHVIFYPQHQDDETLWGASAIVEALKECGEDNVYVVLVSDGSGVNVFNQLEEFKGITRKEKSMLRNNEFRLALNNLGVKDNNIIILSEKTKKQGTHYDLMEKTILDFENKFRSVTHIAQHYKYDNHPMHRKNGEVLKKLSDEGKIKDARYFIKPDYVKCIPKDKIKRFTANDEESKKKVKAALDAYKIKDEKNKLFGIGYISTHNYFDHLYNDPEYTSTISFY